MKLSDAMRLLYSQEINCGISCFWDGGWNVWLGDVGNGIRAGITVDDPDEAGDWLIAAAREHFPGCKL